MKVALVVRSSPADGDLDATVRGLFPEARLGVEAPGFLARHLGVLLDPARIVPTLHQAHRDPAFHQARCVILMTGPSATADIEGVLIHGAQGIRSLTVLPVA